MKYGSVYLIGPLEGKSYNDVNSWREHASLILKRKNITCYSPLRRKNFKGSGDQKMVSKKRGGVLPVFEQSVITSKKGTVIRDYLDVRRCDVGFANFLDVNRISKGSLMECGGFITQGKPLVVVMEEDNIHNHPLLNHHALITRSVNEGIKTVEYLLSPC